MYVCICKAVTEAQLRAAVETGSCSPQDVIAALGLDDPANCGRCLDRAERILDLPCAQQASEVLDARASSPALRPAPAI